MVAPLHDGNIGFDPGLGFPESRGGQIFPFRISPCLTHPFPASQFSQDLWEQVNGLGTDDEVQVGNPVQQLLALLLGHASGHSNDRPSPLFQPLVPSEGAVDLMLGFFANAAGVNEDEICLIRLLCFDVVQISQETEDSVGIVLIHLATVGLDIDASRHLCRGLSGDTALLE